MKSRSNLQRNLLRWYAANKRAMPWRGTRDAYRIWLSEVMLQQTRVAAVEAYYTRFVRRFPTVQSLARARSEAVLRHWAGLGYYSRARNLHAAAKQLVAQHGGKFPRSFDAALALPGVGRYTAAAVLSIAYGQRYAVLDGNVARVLARLFAVRGDLRAPKKWQQLQVIADDLLPLQNPNATKRRRAAALQSSPSASVENPGDWNQAMMELGATVCTPRAPRCDVCPIAAACRAHKLGITAQLPAKRVKRATEAVTIAAGVLLDAQGRTALVRQRGGLFSGMWQFPAVTVNGEDPRAALTTHVCRGGFTPPAPSAQRWRELPIARHTVTYRDITLRPFLLRVSSLPRIASCRVVQLGAVDSLPISSATRKIAQRALQATADKS